MVFIVLLQSSADLLCWGRASHRCEVPWWLTKYSEFRITAIVLVALLSFFFLYQLLPKEQVLWQITDYMLVSILLSVTSVFMFKVGVYSILLFSLIWQCLSFDRVFIFNVFTNVIALKSPSLVSFFFCLFHGLYIFFAIFFFSSHLFYSFFLMVS